jgi:hypothetical protein
MLLLSIDDVECKRKLYYQPSLYVSLFMLPCIVCMIESTESNGIHTYVGNGMHTYVSLFYVSCYIA